MAVHGYAAMTVIEETLAAYLALTSAPSWISQPLLLSKPAVLHRCWTGSSHSSFDGHAPSLSSEFAHAFRAPTAGVGSQSDRQLDII